MFIYAPEQTLDLVGNSVSFEGYEQADALAVASSAVATLSGVSVYLQPDELAIATPAVASFAIDQSYIRLMSAVATPAVAQFVVGYPSNELLYYDTSYE